VLAGLRRQFDLLNSSIWGRVEFPVWIGTRPKTATLHLPNGSAVPVRINASEESVSLHLDNPIPGWRAASIVLFHPQGPIGETLEVSVGERRTAEPVRPATRKTPARHGQTVPDGKLDTAWDVSARHQTPGWRSPEALDSAGGRAWLDDSDGLVLTVNLPETAPPAEQVHYRLEWQDADDNEFAEQGRAPLVSNSGRRFGIIRLNAPVAAVKSASFWSLSVEPVLAPSAAALEPEDFHQVSGENLQVLILNDVATEPERSATALQARFYSEHQRALWNDDTAACWVRFETDDWQPGEAS
jgi:hypothetical protein